MFLRFSGSKNSFLTLTSRCENWGNWAGEVPNAENKKQFMSLRWMSFYRVSGPLNSFLTLIFMCYKNRGIGVGVEAGNKKILPSYRDRYCFTGFRGRRINFWHWFSIILKIEKTVAGVGTRTENKKYLRVRDVYHLQNFAIVEFITNIGFQQA